MQHYNCPQGLWNARLNYGYHSSRFLFDKMFGDLLTKNWLEYSSMMIPYLYSTNFYESEPYLDNKVEEAIIKRQNFDAIGVK